MLSEGFIPAYSLEVFQNHNTPALHLNTSCWFSSCLTRGAVSKFRVQIEAVSTIKFLLCYPHATSLPTELLIPNYFIWPFIPHFLMLVGLDGLCAVTYLFIVSCVCSILHLCSDFQIHHFLPEPSLPWPCFSGPGLDLAASTFCFIYCSGSPSLSSSLYKHPLLLASSFPEETGESGEGESTLEQKEPPQQWGSGLKSVMKI